MTAPRLSVIVPTYNSARQLDRLLASLLETDVDDTQFEVLVNDDPNTDDDTAAVVQRFVDAGLPVRLLRTNTLRSMGRKSAASECNGDILLHLDSDMLVDPRLLGECITEIDSGIDALIVPERSFGTTFWARCRGLEKLLYDGVDEIEAARCVRRTTYDAIGGHHDSMVFAEDKDLDLRLRAHGAEFARTQSVIRHDEGAPTLRTIMEKKGGYAESSHVYAAAHKVAFDQQVSIVARLRILASKPKLIARHPLLFVGLLMIGSAEYLGLLKSRRVRPPAITQEPSRRLR